MQCIVTFIKVPVFSLIFGDHCIVNYFNLQDSQAIQSKYILHHADSDMDGIPWQLLYNAI